MPNPKAMKDYYAILEVSPTAPQETIKEQYHFLIQAWHPDKFSNPTQKAKAEEKSKEINAAYGVLKNPQKRAQYDNGRSGQSSQPREEQKRRQTEEQRQRKQAEEAHRRAEHERQQRKQAEEEQQRAYYERRQRERADEEQRRTNYERQKREKAEKEKHHIEIEQTQRNQPKQPSAEVNRIFQNPIRVLIVDDVQVTRENIWKLVRDLSDIVVVGEAADGVEAIEQFDKLMPDIVTMNIHMPRMDGITSIERICKRHPGAKIIVLSVDDSLNIKRRASLAGAKEYFVKPPYGEEFIDAIRRVAGQRTPK
jgi:curved DNA-binding protein CbpA